MYKQLTAVLLSLCLFPACVEEEAPTRTLTSKLPARVYAVGAFHVHWLNSAADGPAIKVTHVAAPHRVIWETRPGSPFLSAAIGSARIEERRGAFKITDSRADPSVSQTVDHILHGAAGLIFGGTLAGDAALPYTLTFHAVDGEQLRFEVSLGAGPHNRVLLRYRREADERFFGFGEQFTHLDLRGRRVPVLIQEQGIGRGKQPLTGLLNLAFGAGGDALASYAAVPHYLTSESRSLFLENDEYSVFDLSEPEIVQIELFASKLSGRILAGEGPLELIEVYTRYAGRMKPLPDWLGRGAVIGMQGGSAAVTRMLALLDTHDVPVSAFWLQDWCGTRRTAIGKQLWWNWEVDHESYPDWEAMIHRLKARKIRVMGYVNPFLVDPTEKGGVTHDLFAEAKEKGYLLRNEAGEPYLIPNTTFSAAMLDLTNPEARHWIKGVITREFLARGVAGWMADFGEALPFDAHLHHGSTATEHNLYAERWAALNREAIEEAGLEGEVVFFSRSGYTRSPRHSTLFWLGDQLTSWDGHDGLQTALTGLLSSGFSGYSLNHSDIGGYTAVPLFGIKRRPELMKRWIELNAFTAVFRTHEGNDPAANVQIDHDTSVTEQFARFARLYASLASYRKGLMAEAARKGTPLVRHPWLHYTDDPVAVGLTRQFMLGRDLMVAPVMDKGKTSVEIYLPAGRWTHLWSGTRHVLPEGRWLKVSAPIGKPAVFYRTAAHKKLLALIEAAK